MFAVSRRRRRNVVAGSHSGSHSMSHPIITVAKDKLPDVKHSLVRSGFECNSADTRIGFCTTPEDMASATCCAEMCFWIPACNYFSYSDESHQCWWEHTGNDDCVEGWSEGEPGVAMYKIDERNNEYSWKQIRRWTECTTPNTKLGADGLAESVEQCAQVARARGGRWGGGAGSVGGHGEGAGPGQGSLPVQPAPMRAERERPRSGHVRFPRLVS